MLTLAATVTDKSSRLFQETLPWIILLMGVIVAGGVIIFIARRYINAGNDGARGGFTLHDLREMHKAGEMSDDEFARAKAQMIGRLAREKTDATNEDSASSTGNASSSKN
jgi:hypothetical protein